jgi:hypothetical protein
MPRIKSKGVGNLFRPVPAGPERRRQPIEWVGGSRHGLSRQEPLMTTRDFDGREMWTVFKVMAEFVEGFDVS